MTNISSLPESELWKIDLKSDDPLDLFTTWHREANKNCTVACLSTSSADNKPHSRHVLLRHFDQNGFVFITDNRSRKIQELKENEMLASMCIFWSHHNDKNDLILRQARIEGKVEIISRDEVKKCYDSDPLYTKIRAHLCHQDAPVDWDELKKRHDELLKEAREHPENLPLPDHVISRKSMEIRLLCTESFYREFQELQERTKEKRTYLHYSLREIGLKHWLQIGANMDGVLRLESFHDC